jgi:hypothetical protein
MLQGQGNKGRGMYVGIIVGFSKENLVKIK